MMEKMCVCVCVCVCVCIVQYIAQSLNLPSTNKLETEIISL